ncbi:MAG: hemin uptake protein HemP [Hydrogenophaga sp.]|nr:hemin uptake protein HemP [Hydrogenophaga sp.]
MGWADFSLIRYELFAFVFILRAVNAAPPPPPPNAPAVTAAATPPRVPFAELSSGRREVYIEHAGQVYRLSLTAQNKLILTK